MSMLLYRNWNNDFLRPMQMLDQHFGLGLHPEELLAPLTIPANISHTLLRTPALYRPWPLARQDSGASMKIEKDKFQVNIDVQQFTPEEITVKSVDNQIIVEGKHEEKPDEHGFVSRQFVRKYVLPEGYDMDDVLSHLSSDGILTITAPKIGATKKERYIPVRHAILDFLLGPPHHKKGEHKKDEEIKADEL